MIDDRHGYTYTIPVSNKETQANVLRKLSTTRQVTVIIPKTIVAFSLSHWK